MKNFLKKLLIYGLMSVIIFFILSCISYIFTDVFLDGRWYSVAFATMIYFYSITT